MRVRLQYARGSVPMCLLLLSFLKMAVKVASVCIIKITQLPSMVPGRGFVISRLGFG